VPVKLVRGKQERMEALPHVARCHLFSGRGFQDVRVRCSLATSYTAPPVLVCHQSPIPCFNSCSASKASASVLFRLSTWAANSLPGRQVMSTCSARWSSMESRSLLSM